MILGHVRGWSGSLSLGIAIAATVAMTSPRPANADEIVYSCGYLPNEVFAAYTTGVYTQATCPGGGLTLSADAVGYKAGQNAIWQADAPPGLVIGAVTVPEGALQSQYVNAGSSGDFGGDFYWDGGSSNITPG
jgi:hypothetical protein